MSVYLLLAAPAVVTSKAQLVHVKYGWPFKWLEQDLSRYQPSEFPVAIEFNWTRAWDDPIVTTYDWTMMILGVLVIGVGVTAVYFVLVSLLRWGFVKWRPTARQP